MRSLITSYLIKMYFMMNFKRNRFSLIIRTLLRLKIMEEGLFQIIIKSLCLYNLMFNLNEKINKNK